MFCVVSLDTSTILEHDRAEVTSCMSTINRTTKTLLYQERNKSGMINMGMGENKCIYFISFERKKFIGLIWFFSTPLKHTTIKEKCLAIHAKDMFWACNSLSCADEFELHTKSFKINTSIVPDDVPSCKDIRQTFEFSSGKMNFLR